jgi:adenylate kinase family enzyme
VQRVSVVGVPGSGKTTTGRRLAAALSAPFVELDALFHLAGWQEPTPEDFRTEVRRATDGPTWVVDGNYAAVQELIWERADIVVWLDLPRLVATTRVARRTVRRAWTRQQLWNGNREPLTNFTRWDPEHNIVRWSWIKHPEYARRYGEAMVDPRYAHLQFVRLSSVADIERFLDSIVGP